MKSIIGLTVLAGSVLLASGCATNPNDVSFRALKREPAPELFSTTERVSDAERHLAINVDTNWRLFWDDLARASLQDQPSKLSPFPIMSTSGQPR